MTLKDLILRPGFLTREYTAGRRVRYLNPIRMYVFISALFFLALYAGKEEPPAQETAPAAGAGGNIFRQQFADSLRAAAKGGGAKPDSIRRVVNGEMAARLDTTVLKPDRKESASMDFTSSGMVVLNIIENKYNTLREYDSIQALLPDSARDRGVMSWILRNNIRMKEKHGRSSMHLEINIQHTIPKIMFVLLPLFALLVGIFYSRGKYYYTQHVIFSMHFHSLYFLIFLFFSLFSLLFAGHAAMDTTNPSRGGAAGWGWVTDWAEIVAVVFGFVYLVLALKNVYRQSVWLSLLKAMAISLLYFISIILAFWIVGVFAFMRA